MTVQERLAAAPISWGVREVAGWGHQMSHTHLKDVNAGLAERVRAGELSYSAAVRAGMYRPLGRGDVDITAIVSGLEANAYDGWYVMEQDTILIAEPPAGEGPSDDVRASLAFLAELRP